MGIFRDYYSICQVSRISADVQGVSVSEFKMSYPEPSLVVIVHLMFRVMVVANGPGGSHSLSPKKRARKGIVQGRIRGISKEDTT